MDIVRGVFYYLGYIYGKPETLNKEEANECITIVVETSKGEKVTLCDELHDYFKKKNIGVDI